MVCFFSCLWLNYRHNHKKKYKIHHIDGQLISIQITDCYGMVEIIIIEEYDND